MYLNFEFHKSAAGPYSCTDELSRHSSYRLRSRLLRRPDRCRWTSGRCVDRVRLTVCTDLRNARRAHTRAGQAWRAGRTQLPATSRCSMPSSAPCWPAACAHGIRIVSNFGAANPRGAALRIRALAAELGLDAPRIAIVGGDDVSGPQHRAELESQIGEAPAGVRSSAPTRISVPNLSPVPCAKGRRSWSQVVYRIRL